MRYFLHSPLHKISFLEVLLLLVLAADTKAQLVVTNTLTPAQLVQNVLLGSGVTVTNITFNGGPANTITEQVGFFNSTNANVGLTEGIILATGSVMNALGPNNSGSASLGGGNWGQTDPDLEVLAGVGVGINDAAVLEFDLTTTSDSLSIRFVFASDEYLEFVFSINDVFGIFLSGPGITGPFSDNAVNIARVPGTSHPVSINWVNDVVNPAYYSDNGTGVNAPYSTDPFHVQYDGLTAAITAHAQVTSGQVYHLKIAVGDASDTVWDSAVFLEAGSLSDVANSAPDRGRGSVLEVFPVPFTESLHVQVPAGLSLERIALLTVDGRPMRDHRPLGPTPAFLFDGLADLPGGVYVIQAELSGACQRRLVIKH